MRYIVASGRKNPYARYERQGAYVLYDGEDFRYAKKLFLEKAEEFGYGSVTFESKEN